MDIEENSIIKDPHCFGCRIAAGHIVPPGGDIWRDTIWHFAHDANNVIPGFLVLGTIPHITHGHDIPESHYLSGCRLVRRARQILSEQFALTDYLIFQNDLTSGHYHLWMLPLYPQMRQFGPPPGNILPFLSWTKVQWKTPEKYQEIEHIAETLRTQIGG